MQSSIKDQKNTYTYSFSQDNGAKPESRPKQDEKNPASTSVKRASSDSYSQYTPYKKQRKTAKVSPILRASNTTTPTDRLNNIELFKPVGKNIRSEGYRFHPTQTLTYSYEKASGNLVSYAEELETWKISAKHKIQSGELGEDENKRLSDFTKSVDSDINELDFLCEPNQSGEGEPYFFSIRDDNNNIIALLAYRHYDRDQEKTAYIELIQYNPLAPYEVRCNTLRDLIGLFIQTLRVKRSEVCFVESYAYSTEIAVTFSDLGFITIDS